MKIKKTVMALVTTALLALTGSANAAFLTNWVLDTNGGAAGGSLVVGEYLDLTGTAYVHNVYSDATHFMFQESASFRVFSADSATLLPNVIRGEFVGTGSGVLSPAGGSLAFNFGVLNVFDGVNNLIGTFDLTQGGANLLPGSALPNGTINTSMKASFLASGYFFDSVGGTDLSTIVADPAGLVFGFATTNASLITGASAKNTAMVANTPIYTSFFNTAPVFNNYGVDNLIVSNNGQFRFQIPEPAPLALMGLGLALLGLTMRNKSGK